MRAAASPELRSRLGSSAAFEAHWPALAVIAGGVAGVALESAAQAAEAILFIVQRSGLRAHKQRMRPPSWKHL